VVLCFKKFNKCSCHVNLHADKFITAGACIVAGCSGSLFADSSNCSTEMRIASSQQPALTNTYSCGVFVLLSRNRSSPRFINKAKRPNRCKVMRDSSYKQIKNKQEKLRSIVLATEDTV
jgi:hypothetical protein